MSSVLSGARVRADSVARRADDEARQELREIRDAPVPESVERMEGRNALDAARVDGANIFQVYARVALPLCAPTLATLAVTTFMESWNDYLWPLLMLTDRAKMTLPIALSTLNGQYNTEYNVLMAGSLISMIPIIIIYLFAQKHFKNGLMAGGIKG